MVSCEISAELRPIEHKVGMPQPLAHPSGGGWLVARVPEWQVELARSPIESTREVL